MSDKKQIKKNPHPLVVKGIFYVTASYEEKQYVVSNGLSFIRFVKEGEDEIQKGDYVEIHGPVYQRKEAANPIITGEAIVRKLSEEEVDTFKSAVSEAVAANKKSDAKTEKKTSTKKSTAKKSEEKKMPWE